jgi:hypothetical protein
MSVPRFFSFYPARKQRSFPAFSLRRIYPMQKYASRPVRFWNMDRSDAKARGGGGGEHLLRLLLLLWQISNDRQRLKRTWLPS